MQDEQDSGRRCSRAARRFMRQALFLLMPLALGSCLSNPAKVAAPPGAVAPEALSQPAAGKPADASQDEGKEIRSIILSPGDQMRISIYGHPQLSREVTISPDGRFTFPIVGEVNARGISLADLRAALAKGLSADKPYRLSTGDRLQFRVYRHADLDALALVPPDGMVSLPLVGALDLRGRTLPEAQRMLEQSLQRFIRDPQVTVQLVEAAGPLRIENPDVAIEMLRLSGQKFFVLGEGRNPGLLPRAGGVRRGDAIATAGGTTPDGKNSQIIVISAGHDGIPPKARAVDLETFFKQGDKAMNPVLTPGDVVYVPRTFAAKLDRVMQHVFFVVRPLVNMADGVWLGQNIDAGPWRGR
jgi:polysaccharide biosynthesis/export protein